MKKAGNVVGYMGDGINDASQLHAADVGNLCGYGRADVAKDAADIVLTGKKIWVVLIEGSLRKEKPLFANTLKYVFMATSANFSEICSGMAGISLFIPFLPYCQEILLTNLLTDFPEMTIATE